MKLGGKARAHKGDQGIRRQHQNDGDQEQQSTDAGIERRKDVRPFRSGAPAQHAHHGAVEGAIDSPEQDQEKSRQHIGVVVGVIGSAHPEGRCNHQLPNQATHLAQQGAEGHHQCDPLQ